MVLLALSNPNHPIKKTTGRVDDQSFAIVESLHQAADLCEVLRSCLFGDVTGKDHICVGQMSGAAKTLLLQKSFKLTRTRALELMKEVSPAMAEKVVPSDKADFLLHG